MKPIEKEEVINKKKPRIILFARKNAVVAYVIFSFLLAVDRPDWVNSIPQDNDHYIGIGRANIDTDNYEEAADESALRLIARQIRSDVYSISEKTITEIDDITIGNEYQTISKVSTIADIPGAIKADSYKDKKDYHVLWKLNKKKHKKNIDDHKRSALSNYDKYKQSSADDPYDQLSYLIPCFESVLRSLGIDFTKEGTGEDLPVEIPKILRSIISGFELNGKTSFEGVMRRPLDDDIIVRLSYTHGSGNVFGPKRVLNPNRIPISISFTEGRGKLSSATISTDRSGISKFEMVEINPLATYTLFFAFIDLKKFRTMGDFEKFDEELDEISKDRTLDFELYATETAKDEVAIILLADGFSKSNLKSLKASFRSEFSQEETFTIIMESTVDKLLEEWEKEARDICNDRSCLVQIGNSLNVNKLIFNEITYNSEEVTCHVFLTNIDKQDIEFEKNYDLQLPPDIDGSNEDKVVRFIKTKANEVVSHFFRMANRGKLRLSLPITNVTAEIKNVQPQRWDDATVQKTLPLIDVKLPAGEYEIELRRPGFENRTVVKYIGELQLIDSEDFQAEIMLRRKDEIKAFKRSLLFPGLGQFYEAEPGYQNRKYMGMAFAAAAVGSALMTMNNWSLFFEHKKEYEDANATYLGQKLLDDVVYHREIAKEKNEIMLETFNRTILSSVGLVFVWVGSAFEAKWNFPEYQRAISFDPQRSGMALTTYAGALGINIDLSWSL